MQTITIHLKLEFGRKQFLALSVFGFLCLGVRDAGSDTLKMTTYYPSPVGVYKNLTATSDVILARDGGKVEINGGTHPSIEYALIVRNKPIYAIGGLVVPCRSGPPTNLKRGSIWIDDPLCPAAGTGSTAP